MIAYVGRMVAQPGQRGDLLACLQALVDAAADEPGTIAFTIHTVDDDPDVVTSYELFADEDALVAHQQSATIARVIPQLEELVAALSFVRMTPVFGKDAGTTR